MIPSLDLLFISIGFSNQLICFCWVNFTGFLQNQLQTKIIQNVTSITIPQLSSRDSCNVNMKQKIHNKFHCWKAAREES